jgi:valyl-tRNA synthetase
MMVLRTFFWNDICDNYVEAIKHKFYSDDENTRINSLKNALNLFYKLLTLSSVIMPFISEEIYSILYKKFKNLKSIHLEKWPLPYKMISEDLANNGKLIVEIIKFLRMQKSKLQIPLNQYIKKVILISNTELLEKIVTLKEDIKNTLRIEDLEIIEKSQEKDIAEKSDLTDKIEDLDIKVYVFK